MHGDNVSGVVMPREVAQFAMRSSGAHAPNESGGMLIGYVDGGLLYLTHATPPGPRAVHQPDLFVRDGDYSQLVLEAALAESNGRHDYVGEWHSHPFSQGPSSQDRISMKRIGEKASYACAHPALLLCRRHRRGWRLETYQWDGSFLARRPLQSGSST
jgi:integrative and conjugative element protein (TIGR02256 family)